MTQRGKNGAVNILIDPFFDKESGLRSPKLEADLILNSQSNFKIIPENYFLISDAGEYDVKEVFIEGIEALTKEKKGEVSEKTIIYTIEAEEIKICHLGFLGQKELTEEQLERIGDVDILMIPVGGGKTIESSEAIKIMSQIEPKIIIPMFYRIPKLKIKLDGLEKFSKVLGIKSLEALPKLSLKRKDIPEEEVKIITLEP